MTKAEILQMVQDAIDSGATVSIDNGTFVITFPDGTVKTIVAPFLFLNEDPIPAEAGDLVQGTGATHYDDDMGDLIDVLNAQGVIPPVEMSFSVPELEPTPVLLDSSGDESVSTPQGDDSSIPDPDPDPEPEPDPEPDPEPESDPEPTNFDIQTNDWNGHAQIPSAIFDHFNGVVVDNLVGSNGEAGGDDANVVNSNDGPSLKAPTPHEHNWFGSFDYDGDNLDGTGEVDIHAIDHGKVDLKDINSDFAGNGQYKLLISDGEHDALVGSEGSDLIIGSGNDEVLHGGQDSAGDILIGGDGDDVLFGTHGDVLIGDGVVLTEAEESGYDVSFDGSVGDDTFKFVDSSVKDVDILDFDAEHDTVDLSGLGVDDSDIDIDDHDDGTATVTVDGENFDITIHYDSGTPITFDVLDGMITATVDV